MSNQRIASSWISALGRAEGLLAEKNAEIERLQTALKIALGLDSGTEWNYETAVELIETFREQKFESGK